MQIQNVLRILLRNRQRNKFHEYIIIYYYILK